MNLLHWLEMGGSLMFVLLAVGLSLYSLLVYRSLCLYSGLGVRLAREGRLGNELLIRALIAAAPLVGLLGTVSGMIMTFRGLQQDSAVQTEVVAQGIQYALRTTQYGLSIAAPALLLERLLHRRRCYLETHTPEHPRHQRPRHA